MLGDSSTHRLLSLWLVEEDQSVQVVPVPSAPSPPRIRSHTMGHYLTEAWMCHGARSLLGGGCKLSCTNMRAPPSHLSAPSV